MGKKSEITKDRRAAEHRRGAKLLAEGDYAGAVTILRNCVEEFGPHVGPLSDLVFAAYLYQDMGVFNLAVEQLEAEFALALPHLSPKAAALTRVVLSKSFELQGRIAEAFDEIEKVLGLLPRAKGNSLVTQSKCQKLRLLATFGREKELSELYRECLGISEDDPQQMIECFHALLLAEARLLSLSVTWPRFLHLSRSLDLQAADLRLALVDLLEIALETRDETTQALILDFVKKKKVTGFDQYESVVLQMARAPQQTIAAAEIFEWKRKIPYFGIIRLLALELERRDEKSPAVVRQLQFYLHSLDHRSRRLVSKKWAPLLAGGEGSLVSLDVKTKSLRLGPSTLSFAKSPQSWALLKTLVAQREILPAELLGVLEKKDNIQNMESLRISTLRLNRKLTGFLSLPWVVRFSKEKVTLNPAVQAE